MLSESPASQMDKDNIVPAPRMRFVGNDNKDEDDFEGYPYYANLPVIADRKPDLVSKKTSAWRGALFSTYTETQLDSGRSLSWSKTCSRSFFCRDATLCLYYKISMIGIQMLLI